MKRSFTLIELLVSIGVMVLSLTVTAGILMSVVRSYQKQRALSGVQNNGDFVMRVLKEKVQMATGVDCVDSNDLVVTCNEAAPGTILRIQDASGTSSYAGTQDGVKCSNKIAYLTNDLATIGDSQALTNDMENGVHIERLEFVVFKTGNLRRVAVTMDVKSSQCSSLGISRRFQKLITVRSTYR